MQQQEQAARHPSQKSHGPASDRQASVLLAKDPKTLEAAYDKWAKDYDTDLVQLCGTELRENVPGLAATRVMVDYFGVETLRNMSNILDFGCGTGPAALFLHQQPRGLDTKQQLDGCDLSQGMLNMAAQRNLYRNLIKADFESSHCETAKYDLVHASGVFAPGQAPPTAFDEFLRLLKPNGKGHAVFTIRVGYYDSDEGAAHRDYLEKLVAEQKWTMLVKREVPYLPNDGVNAYVFVMKKL